RSHPQMAFIPKIHWLQGSERVSKHSEGSFWIDLWPVTTAEYVPKAEQLVQEGRLDPSLSVLLRQQIQPRAVDATNSQQLPKLMGQLQKVFDVIDAESRATGRPDPSNTKPPPEPRFSCPKCPAKLTIEEAQLYCQMQHKRFPTDLEWEL